MTREQVHDLMENELRCVKRGNYCDRDCAKCPLVKDDKELIEAYGYVIKALEQQPKTGHWILADEQNKEDTENDNYRFICSECQCSDIHAKGTKVPYCWKCGSKMESEE